MLEEEERVTILSSLISTCSIIGLIIKGATFVKIVMKFEDGLIYKNQFSPPFGL